MDRRLNRVHVWILSAVTALAGFGHQSFAQIVDIPENVRTGTGSLSDQDKATVKAYVDANSKNLLESDPAKAEDLRRDKNAILDKLKGSNISVSFRLVYSNTLQDVVSKMLASPNEKTVINGLVIAGELATDQSIQAVMSKLNDKAPAVRFEAACSLGKTFRAAQVNQRATNRIGEAVRAIQAQLAGEENPHVRAALIRAGIDGANLPDERGNAITVVSKGLGDAIRKNRNNPLTPDDLTALLTGGVGLRNVATQAVQQNIAIPATTAADAAECSGLLLVAIADTVAKAKTPEAVNDRPRLLQLATSAVNTIDLTAQLMGAQTSIGLNPQATLGKGTKDGDAQFALDVKGAIEKLTKAPWNIPEQRFK